MKTIAVAGLFLLIAYLAYVSASMEMGYIESTLDSCRHKSAGENCLQSAPVRNWNLAGENPEKCPETDSGCELRDT